MDIHVIDEDTVKGEKKIWMKPKAGSLKYQ